MEFFKPLINAILRGDDVAVSHIIDLGNFSHDLSEADANGMTALHWAAISPESEKLFPLLLSHGTSIQVCDLKGLTPLHLCCAQGRLYGVTCLLHKGANPNALSTESITPLHLAVQHHHSDIARLLLSFGANTSLESVDGRSADDLGLSNLLSCT